MTNNYMPDDTASPVTSVKPFLALEDARGHHNVLLGQVAELENPDVPSQELSNQIREFRRRMRATGAVLCVHRDRAVARQMQDFWGDYLYRTKGDRDWASGALDPFEKSVAESLKDLVDDQYPFGRLGRTPRCPEDLIAGLRSLAEQAVRLLEERRLLIVIGPADSGRSSLVRAGVAELWKRRNPNAFAAEESVVVAAADQFEWTQDGIRLAGGRQRAKNESPGPRRLSPEASPEGVARPANLAANAKIVSPRLLIVDGLDGLVAKSSEAELRKWCEQLFAYAHGEDRLRRVILIARSEQQRLLATSPEIGPLLENSVVRVKARESQQLIDAIAEPARVVGLVFESGLIEQLVNDCLGDPAALSWLRFVLRELWSKRDRNWIGWDAYVELGGADIVNVSLDSLYRSLSESGARTFKRVMMRSVVTDRGEYRCPEVPIDMLRSQGNSADDTMTCLRSLFDMQLIDALDSNGIETTFDAATFVRFVHPGLVRRWNLLTGWFHEQATQRKIILGYRDLARIWSVTQESSGVLWEAPALVESGRRELDSAKKSQLPGVTEQDYQLIGEFFDASTALIQRRQFLRRALLVFIATVAVVFGLLWRNSTFHWKQSVVNLAQAHQAEFEQRLAEDDVSGALVLMTAQQGGRDGFGATSQDRPRNRMALLARQLVAPRLIERFEGLRKNDGMDGKPTDNSGGAGECLGTVFAPDGSSIVATYQRSLELHLLHDARKTPRVVSLAAPSVTPPNAASPEWQNALYADGGRIVVAVRSLPLRADGVAEPARRQVVAWNLKRLTDDVSVLNGAVLGDPNRWDDATAALTPESTGAGLERESLESGRQWLGIVRRPLDTHAPANAPANAPSNAGKSLAYDCEVWHLDAQATDVGGTRVFSSADAPFIFATVASAAGKEQRSTLAALTPAERRTATPSFRLALGTVEGQNGNVKVWDVAHTGEIVGEQEIARSAATRSATDSNLGALTSLKWSPADSRILAASGTHVANRGPYSEIWLLPVRQVRRTAVSVAHAQKLHYGFGGVCALSPDGVTIATTAGSAALVWRLQQARGTGELERIFLFSCNHDADVFVVAFSGDGRYLITGGRDKMARVWNIGLGISVLPPLRHPGTVSAVAFTPTTETLLTSSGTKTGGERMNFIWPLETGNPHASLVSTIHPRISPVISADGLWEFSHPRALPLVAPRDQGRADGPTGSAAGTSAKSSSLRRLHWRRHDSANVTPMRDEVELERIPEPNAIRAAVFSGDSSHLALVHVGAVNRLFATVWRLPDLNSAGSSGVSVPVRPVHEFTFELAPGEGIVYDAQDVCAAVSNAGDVALSVRRKDVAQGELWVWPTGGDGVPRQRVLWNRSEAAAQNCHSERVTSLAFSLNGELLASGSEDDSARLWLTSTLSSVGRLARHSANVLYVSFARPDSTAVDKTAVSRVTWLMTGGADGKLIVSGWRRLGPGKWHRLKQADIEFDHGSSVTSAAMSADGRLVATAGDDRHARIWDRSSGRLWGAVQTSGHARQVALTDGVGLQNFALLTVSELRRSARELPQRLFNTRFRLDLASQEKSPVTFAIEFWRTEPRASEPTSDHIAIATELLSGRTFSASAKRLSDFDFSDFLQEQGNIFHTYQPNRPDLFRDGALTIWKDDVNECLALGQWFSARQLLLQGLARWPDRIDGRAARTLLAHVQTEHVAESLDNEAVCRELDLAFAAYGDAVSQFEPGKAPHELLLAQAWLNQRFGRWVDAARAYQEAIATSDSPRGEWPRYFDRLATCEAERGASLSSEAARNSAFDAAIVAFAKVVELQPEPTFTVDARYSIALIRLAQNRQRDYDDICEKLVAEAESRFRLEEQPGESSYQIANNVAWLGTLASHSTIAPDRLMALAQKSVDANPNDYYRRSTLGGCLYRLSMATQDRGRRMELLLKARGDVLKARELHLVKQLAASSSDADAVRLLQLEDGMPYDWILLAMIETELARLEPPPRNSPEVGPGYWLNKARRALLPPPEVLATTQDRSCTPTGTWRWWQSIEMKILFAEAENSYRAAKLELP